MGWERLNDNGLVCDLGVRSEKRPNDISARN